MRKMNTLLGASVLLACSAVGQSVYADAATMTCGEFGQLSDADRRTAAHDVLLWINDTANFDTAGAQLTGRYDKLADEAVSSEDMDTLLAEPDEVWTDREMKIEIESHCINKPLASTVISQLQAM